MELAAGFVYLAKSLILLLRARQRWAPLQFPWTLNLRLALSVLLRKEPRQGRA